VTRIESEALVVRVVEVGESDVIATLLTEGAGKMGVLARGARKGLRRIGGALEPFHTIAVLVESKGGDLSTLKEAQIVRMRSALASNLDALEAAGMALRWARHLFQPATPEPQGWRILVGLLDRLDDEPPDSLHGASPKAELARAGLAMLAAMGYGLEVSCCVVCGRICPEHKPACFDAARGGLVCRACGGARSVLVADVRHAIRRLATAGAADATLALSADDAHAVLGLLDVAMAAHAGFEP